MVKSLQAYDVDDRSFACAKSCWLSLLLILSISLFGDGKAICQNGFIQTINLQQNFIDPNIDELRFHKNHLWISGNYYNDSTDLWGMFIAKLDTSGQLILAVQHNDTSGLSNVIANTPTSFTINDADEILVPCKFFNFGELGLFKLDSLGQKIFYKIYNEGLDRAFIAMDARQVYDHYYLIGMVQRPNYRYDVYVIKTDSLGNQVWLKHYGVPAYYEIYGDAIVNSDGTITISAGRFDDLFLTDFTIKGWQKPWIFTIDTSGQVTNEWLGEQNDARTLGGKSILKLPNGDWVLVSEEYKECEFPPNTLYCTAPTITRMDSNFNQIWKVYMTDYVHPYDEIIDLEYDSIRDHLIAFGRRFVFKSDDYGSSEAWAIKLSSEGEVIWSVSDTIPRDQSSIVNFYIAGMDLAPSGSIYMSGHYRTIFAPVQSFGWIIKVTPDGCMDTLCTTTSILDQIEKRNKNVYLYPNPADGFFKIHIKDLQGAGKLSIFDLQGRLMLSESVYKGDNHVDVEVPHGLYLYSVLDDGQMIGSGKIVIR